MSKTQKYEVIKPRMVYRVGKERKEHEVGSIIELNDVQAAARAGKVQLVVPESSRLDESVVELLQDAGYVSADAIKAASDDDLLAIDGIGKGTLKKVREFYAG